MLRFIDGKSLKDISEIVHYNSLNVLSATISRSLKLLKSKIHDKLEIKSMKEIDQNGLKLIWQGN